MRKKYRTYREMFLINMAAFVGFAFEFYIRNDLALGTVMIFTGLLNLIAFQQAPRRVATITLFLNFFNAAVASVVAYNYTAIPYVVLSIVWTLLAITFFIASVRQAYSISANKAYRKKQKKRAS